MNLFAGYINSVIFAAIRFYYMKYSCIVLFFLLFSGCYKPDRIEINGIARGIKSGVFGIIDILNKPVYGENISNGKFMLSEQLEYPGFYLVKITNMLNTADKHIPYEVYLENGKYTIEVDRKYLTKYPKITTSSKIQNGAGFNKYMEKSRAVAVNVFSPPDS